jgi:hypothetical protein
MPRFNPRQRWHEDDDHGLGWPVRGSTVAGVSLPDWVELHQLVFEEVTRLPVDPKDADAAAYRTRLAGFAGAIVRGLALLLIGRQGWIEEQGLRMRRGRGGEVTVVSEHYGDMRNFLTNASLGWFERHPCANRDPEKGPLTERTVPTPYMAKIKTILEMLEKSSDRRENTWDYRDRSIAELRANYDHKFTLSRRRAAILSDIKFRKNFDEIFGSLRSAAAARRDESLTSK